jgi:hypothetical protein
VKAAGLRYVRLVLLGALVGIPAGVVAALFLALVHELEHWLWTDLPDALGASSPPWYLVLGLPVAGAAILLAARALLPGDGGKPPLAGHEPALPLLSHGPGSPSPRSGRSASAPCWGPRRPSSRSARSSR